MNIELKRFSFRCFNREVNKQLRDENDSLRAIIEANQSNPIIAYHANLSSPKRLTSTTGSTLGSYWNNSKLDK
jgi:hypothetical protein